MIKRIGITLRDKWTGEQYDEFFRVGNNGKGVFIERDEDDEIPIYQVVSPNTFYNAKSGYLIELIDDMFPESEWGVELFCINQKMINPITLLQYFMEKDAMAQARA